MTTKVEERKISHLIKKIRLSREQWCEMVNEDLKKINTYEGKTDNEIIIEALQHFLWDEEDELETLYDHQEENND